MNAILLNVGLWSGAIFLVILILNLALRFPLAAETGCGQPQKAQTSALGGVGLEGARYALVMARQLLLLAPVLGTLVAVAPEHARAAEPSAPTATLSYAKEKLSLSYDLPDGVKEVRFAHVGDDIHTQVRAITWKVDPACLVLERDSLKATSQGCDAASVTLDDDEVVRDRVYPAMVKFRNGGVLVFTSYLHAIDPNGKLGSIRVRAPTDGIARFRGRKTTGVLVLDPSEFPGDGRGWIYIGPDRFEENESTSILFDDGLPTSAREEVRRVVPRIASVYADHLGRRFPTRPTMYVNWLAREGPDRSLQADVVPGGVVRLSLSGRAWADPGPDALRHIREAVSHELAHLWNRSLAPASDPWVYEGNAELLSIGALLASGSTDAKTATARVMAAFDACILAASDRAWVQVPTRERSTGRIPYTCGLAFQFGALALANRRDPSVDALSFWRLVWEEEPTYTEDSAERFLRTLGEHAGADHLARALKEKSPTAPEALAEVYRAAGVAVSQTVDLTGHWRLQPAQVAAGLMMASCRTVSFVPHTDHILIDRLPRDLCEPFRNGMKLRYFAGVDVIGEPNAAAAATRTACLVDKMVRVRLQERDDELIVPCRELDALARLPKRFIPNLDTAMVAKVFGAQLSSGNSKEP